MNEFDDNDKETGSELPGQTDILSQQETPEQTGAPEQYERASWQWEPGQPVESWQSSQPEQPVNHEQPVQAEQPETAWITGHTEITGQTDMFSAAGQQEHPGQPGAAERMDHTEMFGAAGQQEQPAQSGQPGAGEAAFASPFGAASGAQSGIHQEPAGQGPAGQSNTPPPYTQQAYTGQPYTQQPYTQQPYTQQPYIQQPYAQQQYAGQPYTQQTYAQPAYGQPAGQGAAGQQAYGGSPYAQFSQGQYGPQTVEPKRKKEKKRKEGPGGLGIGRKNTAILVIIVIVACVGSGVGGGFLGASINGNNNVPTNSSNSNPVYTITPSDNSITTTEAVAKKVLASVVGITTTGTVTVDNGFFGSQQGQVTGVGTGMIIDKRGYILTNSHVVLDGSASSIEVLLSSGDSVDGSVIWNDAGLDLAIVKITADGLEPIELGNSDDVLIGSYVAAVGNPLGLEFSGSITQGVVSGLDRTISVSDGISNNVSTMQGLIQVDAAINSGNSGGPLLNSKGQVIGINTAKATAEGMGFAIPINTAVPIVDKVLKDGSFERVFMGVSAADVSTIKSNYPNVDLQADTGACITDVNPGSPAEKGGLKVKDVITAIDGKAITGSDSLIKMLLGYESGDTITVTYNRNGDVLETSVTLLSQSELDKVQQEENPFVTPNRNNTSR